MVLIATIFEQNIEILTKSISKRIGYMICNRDMAINLLNEYEESDTKIFSKLFYNKDNGMLKAKLTFK